MQRTNHVAATQDTNHVAASKASRSRSTRQRASHFIRATSYHTPQGSQSVAFSASNAPRLSSVSAPRVSRQVLTKMRPYTLGARHWGLTLHTSTSTLVLIATTKGQSRLCGHVWAREGRPGSNTGALDMIPQLCNNCHYYHARLALHILDEHLPRLLVVLIHRKDPFD